MVDDLEHRLLGIPASKLTATSGFWLFVSFVFPTLKFLPLTPYSEVHFPQLYGEMSVREMKMAGHDKKPISTLIFAMKDNQLM